MHPSCSQDDFKLDLRRHFVALYVYFGLTLGHFGSTSEHFGDTWGSFSVHLGRLWDHSKVTLCPWGLHWKHFGPFSKNTHFPNWLYWFDGTPVSTWSFCTCIFTCICTCMCIEIAFALAFALGTRKTSNKKRQIPEDFPTFLQKPLKNRWNLHCAGPAETSANHRNPPQTTAAQHQTLPIC